MTRNPWEGNITSERLCPRSFVSVNVERSHHVCDPFGGSRVLFKCPEFQTYIFSTTMVINPGSADWSAPRGPTSASFVHCAPEFARSRSPRSDSDHLAQKSSSFSLPHSATWVETRGRHSPWEMYALVGNPSKSNHNYQQAMRATVATHVFCSTQAERVHTIGSLRLSKVISFSA
jgi:hypothetical protein